MARNGYFVLDKEEEAKRPLIVSAEIRGGCATLIIDGWAIVAVRPDGDILAVHGNDFTMSARDVLPFVGTITLPDLDAENFDDIDYAD